MPAQNPAADATLELTIISTDLFSKTSSNFLSRSSPPPSASSTFVIAWIDPSSKTPSKTLTNKSPTLLHLPLYPPALQNPSSTVSIHLLSSRLPFRRPKLLGAAFLPLSDVVTRSLALPLLKPPFSGRPRGTIRVAARILWCLGPVPPSASGPTAPPLAQDWGEEEEDGSGDLDLWGAEESVCPNGPPLMPDFASVDSEAPVIEDGSGGFDCRSGDFGDVRTMEECRGGFVETNEIAMVGEIRGFCVEMNERRMLEGSSRGIFVDENVKRKKRTGNEEYEKAAWRSFLVGLASGTIASVLVGAAGLSDG